jgi:hypothetical protein
MRGEGEKDRGGDKRIRRSSDEEIGWFNRPHRKLFTLSE